MEGELKMDEDQNQTENTQGTGYSTNQDSVNQENSNQEINGQPEQNASYEQQTGQQSAYQQNDNQQPSYQQSGYQSQNTGYGSGYQQPDQQPHKKKNKSKIAAITAGIVLVLFVIIGAAGAFIGFINRIGDLNNDNNEKAAWEESTDKKQSSSSDNDSDSAIATTAPISVVQSDGSTVGATDVSGIVESVMPCVVSIQSTASVQGYSMFGQQYEQQVDSSGTGFIVGQNEKELLLATNNHVVADSTAIQVTFGDDSTAEAVVKGTDADADLAVVSVALEDVDKDTMDKIKVAVLGDSDKVKVGQMAVAIGNAQGMGQSVTVGYISAKNRELSLQDEQNGGEKKMTFLQTDAAINGGNSGGPLLDVNGNVVGINSAKISDTQVEGMCYAIPISSAIPIINELMNRETLKDDEKGYLGVSLDDISDDAVKMYGVPDGAYVHSVNNNSPADKAGIQEGDIITEVNGVEVSSKSAASDKITSFRAGTEITITLYRQSASKTGYESKEVKATLVTAEEAGIKSSNGNNNDTQKENTPEQQTPNQETPNDGSNGDMGSIFDGMFPW